jgi:hypothetical protein
MRWWPFHRRKRPANNEAAAKAKREATKAVRDAERRSEEIQREMNTFAAQVEAAIASRRHQ